MRELITIENSIRLDHIKNGSIGKEQKIQQVQNRESYWVKISKTIL
jgi:hypothetical protein